REIITQRVIRAKKPWAIAGVSGIVLACALNYIFYYSTWNQVNPDTTLQNVSWKEATQVAADVQKVSTDLKTKDTEKTAKLDLLKKVGQEVVGSADRRILWLEVMLAINQSLPAMSVDVDARAPTPEVKKLPFE